MSKSKEPLRTLSRDEQRAFDVFRNWRDGHHALAASMLKTHIEDAKAKVLGETLDTVLKEINEDEFFGCLSSKLEAASKEDLCKMTVKTIKIVLTKRIKAKFNSYFR